jgi:hypothetical protein
MRKMPCLFEREFHSFRSFTLLKTVTPGCDWVIAGIGTASRKRDGTACLVREGVLYKRYDAKQGKAPPANGIPCDPQPDPVTGHWPHWIPVGEEPESKWHLAAWRAFHQLHSLPLEDGTYELCGPHFSPTEGLEVDRFFKHGSEPITDGYLDRTWDDIYIFLKNNNIEGIVFVHPDGERMVKIRRDDYGLPWKPTEKVQPTARSVQMIARHEANIVLDPMGNGTFKVIKDRFNPPGRIITEEEAKALEADPNNGRVLRINKLA